LESPAEILLAELVPGDERGPTPASRARMLALGSKASKGTIVPT
jgi:hypothetical protein